MKVADCLLGIANEVAKSKLELDEYLKSAVAICPHGSFFKVARLFPKKSLLGFRVNIIDSEAWLKKLEDAGVEVEITKRGRIYVRIPPRDVQKHERILRELIHQAVNEFEQ